MSRRNGQLFVGAHEDRGEMDHGAILLERTVAETGCTMRGLEQAPSVLHLFARWGEHPFWLDTRLGCMQLLPLNPKPIVALYDRHRQSYLFARIELVSCPVDSFT